MSTEIKLDPASHPDYKSLGQVMSIKPLLDDSKYVLVTYDGGQMYLWDIRSKQILSSLEFEECPMCIDFNTTLMQGIIGSPSDNLEVLSLHKTFVIAIFQIILLILKYFRYFLYHPIMSY